VQKLNDLKDNFPVNITHNNIDCVKNMDVIVLAVKPQQLHSVCIEIKEYVVQGTLIVSLAAGVSLSQLEQWLEYDKVVRLMPNTAIAINVGALACTTNHLDQTQLDMIIDLFLPLGNIYVIDESKMNAYIAANGSGIAFVYELMRVFTQKAIESGLDESMAQSIIKNTFSAASSMVDDSTDIQLLIDQVTSKAGTTIEGINTLRQSNLETIIENTFNATIHRAEEISKQFEDNI
ncbi:MAG TPA: pyrroline-5-carboxylate reductase, partial [Erysipelotrichaceae bacterium]|nr:pyrroline-5-carboxylate reductase [Erysipelotrichaceae bacterium]